MSASLSLLLCTWTWLGQLASLADLLLGSLPLFLLSIRGTYLVCKETLLVQYVLAQRREQFKVNNYYKSSPTLRNN